MFRAWAEIFKLGPRELELTGRWMMPADDPSDGEYHRLELSRDELVSSLERIAACCQVVASSGGTQFLMHLGI